MKFKVVVALFTATPPGCPAPIAELGLIIGLASSVGPLILKTLHCGGIVVASASAKRAAILKRGIPVRVVHVLMGARCLFTGRHGVGMG